MQIRPDYFIKPDLGSKCLQRLSADDTSRQIVKFFLLFLSFSVCLPEEIGSLKKLETLSLENNVLTSLPTSMKNLNHLRTLSLTGNGFKTFPDVLCDLRTLDAVDLSKNKITEIPANTRVCQVIELNLNLNQVCYKSESSQENLSAGSNQPPRGWVGIQKLSYIHVHRLAGCFRFKIFNFDIFGCCQKNEYFGCVEIFILKM